MIESSVDLQWTRPSYTGGVDVMNYTVSANGRRLEVMDDSETVMYNADPDVVYGEVQVSAINTCGLESQLAVINIRVAGLYSKFTGNTVNLHFCLFGFHFHMSELHSKPKYMLGLGVQRFCHRHVMTWSIG